VGTPRDGALGVRRWRQWAHVVIRHPGRTLVLAGIPLIVLAAQARRLDRGLPRGDWLPAGMESARAAHELQRMQRGGIIHALRVVIELPAGMTALDDRGWAAARQTAITIASDRRVARVRSLPTLLPVTRPSPTVLALLPPSVLPTFVSVDGRATVLEVIPREGVDARELSTMVRSLRSADPSAITGIAGTRLRVGGLPALNVDYEEAVTSRTPAVLALVIGGTLLALLVAFRSVLIALKAVALNLLSVGAAFGAVVLCFQDGHGIGALGLAAPVDGVFPSVPVLVFCIVFGLSMDYEVFLIGRIAEARRAGCDEADALAEGMARTGGVITSAAAIMVAIFAAFTLGEFLLVKLLGFALAAAVLIDATIVRLVVGPALLRIAGRWNWWPGDGRAGTSGSDARKLRLPREIGELTA
jgi:RND superfamily putative drug exporter